MLGSKRAQKEGAAVAIILIIIALFMTLYVLFIPPADRNQLLNGDISGNNYSSNGVSNTELLAESPGLVTPTINSAIIHRIPSINIFLKDEPQIINLAQSLSVSKGWFSQSTPQLSFSAKDLQETTKVTLFFSVEEATGGDLRIKVNGNTIYSETIKTPGIKIIEIAKSLLKQENTIELSVSSPGIAFWSTNRYSLKDLGIKEEFERKNNEQTETFSMPPTEKNNLKAVKLMYTQQCNFPMDKEFTHLDILINDQRAHSAEIRCVTTDEELELDPNLFVSGTNTITFILEKGDFSLNLIKLQAETTTSERPTYYFSLSQNEADAISSGQKTINLHMLLENNQKNKNARILINNNEVVMQTSKNVFDRNLKDYVVEGTNFIKIVPINSFNIVGLKVNLE